MKKIYISPETKVSEYIHVDTFLSTSDQLPLGDETIGGGSGSGGWSKQNGFFEDEDDFEGDFWN